MASTTNPQTPRSTKFQDWMQDDIPIIDSEESFSDVVFKLSSYFAKAIDTAFTYEQLRTTVAGHSLRPLISNLSEECHHPAIVAALLAARYLFVNSEGDVDAGLNESRALACELVAWQFLTFLSEKELIDYLLYELPENPGTNARPSLAASRTQSPSPNSRNHDNPSDESSPLLRARSDEHGSLLRPPRRASPQHIDHFTNGGTSDTFGIDESETSRRADLDESMAGMNALEIAAIADAKKFLSQSPVQKIVEDIWNGDVIFWESLSVHATKKPRLVQQACRGSFHTIASPEVSEGLPDWLLPGISSALLRRAGGKEPKIHHSHGSFVVCVHCRLCIRRVWRDKGCRVHVLSDGLLELMGHCGESFWSLELDGGSRRT